MAAVPVETARVFPSGAPRARWAAGRLVPAVLLAPSLLFLAVFFALPALTLVLYSVMTQAADGTIGLPLTLAHYRIFSRSRSRDEGGRRHPRREAGLISLLFASTTSMVRSGCLFGA